MNSVKIGAGITADQETETVPEKNLQNSMPEPVCSPSLQETGKGSNLFRNKPSPPPAVILSCSCRNNMHFIPAAQPVCNLMFFSCPWSVIRSRVSFLFLINQLLSGIVVLLPELFPVKNHLNLSGISATKKKTTVSGGLFIVGIRNIISV